MTIRRLNAKMQLDITPVLPIKQSITIENCVTDWYLKKNNVQNQYNSFVTMLNFLPKLFTCVLQQFASIKYIYFFYFFDFRFCFLFFDFSLFKFLHYSTWFCFSLSVLYSSYTCSRYFMISPKFSQPPLTVLSVFHADISTFFAFFSFPSDFLYFLGNTTMTATISDATRTWHLPSRWYTWSARIPWGWRNTLDSRKSKSTGDQKTVIIRFPLLPGTAEFVLFPLSP